MRRDLKAQHRKTMKKIIKKIEHEKKNGLGYHGRIAKK